MRVLAVQPALLAHHVPRIRCPNCCSAGSDSPGPRKKDIPTLSISELLERSLDDGPALELDGASRDRVAAYLRALLAYNEHTNVYSKSAYTHLPFHVQDSITLGLLIGEHAKPRSAVLDMGSGSGLPSLLIAATLPNTPVYAIESKSRKTRFLAGAAKEMGLTCYTPITDNVNEFSRRSYCSVDFVTAKAFKPLPEVAPIAAACIGKRALLQVPVSESQVSELKLDENQLVRSGSRFIYYRQEVKAARVLSKRKAMPLPADAAAKGKV